VSPRLDEYQLRADAARVKAEERRNSALDRMAGNIASGLVMGSDWGVAVVQREIVEVSVRLARLIYAEVRKL
jgi:hypothetical protein